MKIFHSQKKDIYFYKLFLEKKNFIKSPCHKRQKRKKKKKTHHLSPTTPSHTTKNIIPWKIKKIPPSYLENQPNFSLHATQETNPWVSPHLK